jgi:SAM-dependent methyltransferase
MQVVKINDGNRRPGGAAGDPYATLGDSYSLQRRPDPRIGRHIHAALGAASTVLNVGAGTGSYEPAAGRVVAVEPSPVMIAQRPATAAPVVRAVAEHLPFPSQSFDAGLALLTVHHWVNPPAGLAELRRVTRRQVVLTWDQQITAEFWLVRDYLPQIAELDRTLACLTVVARELAHGTDDLIIRPVPVPHNCVDGFLGAYWRRPETYLRPAVRAAMSGIALLDQDVVTAACRRLYADLATGRWHDRNGHLLDRTEYDIGYRLVLTHRPEPG